MDFIVVSSIPDVLLGLDPHRTFMTVWCWLRSGKKETWTGVTRQIMIDKAKVEWVERNAFSLQGTGGRSVSDASTCLMFMSLLRWISRAWRFASFQCHAGSCSMSKTKNTRRQMTGFMPLPGGHGMPYQHLLWFIRGIWRCLLPVVLDLDGCNF